MFCNVEALNLGCKALLCCHLISRGFIKESANGTTKITTQTSTNCIWISRIQNIISKATARIKMYNGGPVSLFITLWAIING